jgi:hypothetical protein
MLALNQNQPERPDMGFFASEFINRLITKNLLQFRDADNVVKVSAAITKLEDDDDIDKKLDDALETLQRAGLGNIGNEILRLVTQKLSFQHEGTDPSGINCDDNDQRPVVLTQEGGECVGAEGPATKKQRLEGTFDVDRSMGNNLDTKYKLGKFRHILEQTTGKNVNTFTGAFRNFYYSVATPILNCLRDHCSDNDDEFQRRWGATFSHSTFKKKCCPGSSSSDGQCGYTG